MNTVNQYEIFEWTLKADASNVDNPFQQISLKAVLTGPDGEKRLDGFYDGGDRFIIRYMPKSEGEYALTTRSNLPALNGLTAGFTALPAAPGNHGPVEVCGTHFRSHDGARAFIMGTTAYVWHHRPQEVREKTLDSFSKYGFNKIRMLFFPKHYTGGYGAIDVSYEPPSYPFEGKPGAFDFTRPNPAYFREYEDRLRELDARGIIADTILFHPYDFGHWDIDQGMDEDQALSYLKYLIARIAAFKNVWWSLANEYDIKMLPDKQSLRVGWDARDWDVIGEFVKARDPSGHPISCHNIPFGRIYPDRPWMSHVSYQHPDTYAQMLALKAAYNKPVIDDEYQYEGNTPDDWGNSTGELELERHWRSVMAGGYATHGEAFIRDNNRDIFWAYGGDMIGQSPKRLKFLRGIVESCLFEEMEPDPVNTDAHNYYALRKGVDLYLIFTRRALPGKHLWIGDWTNAREGIRYKLTTYDAWNCEKISERTATLSEKLPIEDWRVLVLEKI
jgi:hypothetical protein